MKLKSLIDNNLKSFYDFGYNFDGPEEEMKELIDYINEKMQPPSKEL